MHWVPPLIHGHLSETLTSNDTRALTHIPNHTNQLTPRTPLHSLQTRVPTPLSGMEFRRHVPTTPGLSPCGLHLQQMPVSPLRAVSMDACLAPRAVSMIVAEQSSPTIHAQTAVIRSANKDSSQPLVATMPASAFPGLPSPRVFSAEHFAGGDVQRSQREEKDSSTVSPSIPSAFLSSTMVTQQTIQLCDANQGQVVNTEFRPYVTNCYEALPRTISASNTSNPWSSRAQFPAQQFARDAEACRISSRSAPPPPPMRSPRVAEDAFRSPASLGKVPPADLANKGHATPLNARQTDGAQCGALRTQYSKMSATLAAALLCNSPQKLVMPNSDVNTSAEMIIATPNVIHQETRPALNLVSNMENSLDSSIVLQRTHLQDLDSDVATLAEITRGQTCAPEPRGVSKLRMLQPNENGVSAVAVDSCYKQVESPFQSAITWRDSAGQMTPRAASHTTARRFGLSRLASPVRHQQLKVTFHTHRGSFGLVCESSPEPSWRAPEALRTCTEMQDRGTNCSPPAYAPGTSETVETQTPW